MTAEIPLTFPRDFVWATLAMREVRSCRVVDCERGVGIIVVYVTLDPRFAGELTVYDTIHERLQKRALYHLTVYVTADTSEPKPTTTEYLRTAIVGLQDCITTQERKHGDRTDLMTDTLGRPLILDARVAMVTGLAALLNAERSINPEGGTK